MTLTRTSFALLLGTAPLIIMTTPLFAAGGGGSSPSASAAQYDPAVEYQKGIAALKVKDFKGAKTAFDHVIAVAPRDANSHYLAGLSRTGLKDWKGAKRYLEKAVKLDANLIGAHRELGVTYAMLGDKAKATATKSALETKSSSCAGTCPETADLKAAIDAIAAALAAPAKVSDRGTESLLFASTAKGDSLYLGAVAEINEGRYEAAIATLKSSQSSFGPHPDILTYLGFANRKLGRFDEAERYYRDALAVAPNHRGATEYFGELMVERGDMAGAKMMLARLDTQCQFGCAEAEELRRWIAEGRSPHSS